MKNMNQDDNKPVTIAILDERFAILDERINTTIGILDDRINKLMEWMMQNMVTRIEFEKSIDDIWGTMRAMKSTMATSMATKKDIQKIYEYMDENLAKKSDMVAIMTEIDKNREERTFYSHQILRLDDGHHNQEKRISKLEQKQV